MIVRAHIAQDDAACAAIFGAAWNYAFPNAPRLISATMFRMETEDEDVFVAEREGRIVGFGAVFAPEAFLHHLYVDPAQHRAGVGSALLAYARTIASEPLTLKCQRSNRQALGFYARHGFEEIGGGEDSTGAWAHLRAPR